MPNVKFYIDEALLNRTGDKLKAALPSIRTTLCESLQVGREACQFAILPVSGMTDQPLANVELMILQKKERTLEVIREICAKVQVLCSDALGTHVAVRAMPLDPETYVALK